MPLIVGAVPYIYRYHTTNGPRIFTILRSSKKVLAKYHSIGCFKIHVLFKLIKMKKIKPEFYKKLIVKK
jgi:hypothetical protein